MTATAADTGSSALAALMRGLGVAALGLGAALALFFALAAGLVVGLMVAGASLALRLWPRAKGGAEGPQLLEARRTPSGWVVETTARKA